MDSQKKDPLYKSFGYAFEGIGTCIKKERNMKIHCAAAVLVCLGCRHLSMQKFGGITGDTQGFFLQVCELVMAFVVILIP